MTSYQIRTPSDFGRVIADRRHAQQQTQADLASTAGLSRAYLAKIEGGRSSSVVEHTFRVLRRLGATVTVSFDNEPPSEHS